MDGVHRSPPQRSVPVCSSIVQVLSWIIRVLSSIVLLLLCINPATAPAQPQDREGSYLDLVSVERKCPVDTCDPVCNDDCNRDVSKRIDIYTIKQPDIRRSPVLYNGSQGSLPVCFQPGDEVSVIDAGGCAQTGGWGDTWKRYVDPDPSDMYYGSIQIPGMPEMRRIKDVLPTQVAVPPFVVPNGLSGDALCLKLGYSDDDYPDNGYWGKDDGNGCEDKPFAYIKLAVKTPVGDLCVQPLSILEAPVRNAPPPPELANNDFGAFCGNQTIRAGLDEFSFALGYENNATPLEWRPVRLPSFAEVEARDSDIDAVVGWVALSEMSDDDLPWTHPFGNDWEIFIATDPKWSEILPQGQRFSALLGTCDSDTQDCAYVNAARSARCALGLTDELVAGIAGVEVDQGLLPGPFRPTVGDRVAVFGRWIADCGHKDLHAEIHPPLLVVVANALDASRTQARFVARPFLTGQKFDVSDDGQSFNGPIEKVVSEVRKYVSFLLSREMEVRAPLLDPIDKSGGTFEKLVFTVSPPNTGTAGQRLRVRWNISTMPGVRVDLTPSNMSVTARVTIDGAALSEALKFPRTRQLVKRDLKIGREWLKSFGEKDEPDEDINYLTTLFRVLSAYLERLGPLGLLGSPTINGDLYDDPADPAPPQVWNDMPVAQLATLPRNNDGGLQSIPVNPAQIFPVVGWVEVYWEGQARQIPPAQRPATAGNGGSGPDTHSAGGHGAGPAHGGVVSSALTTGHGAPGHGDTASNTSPDHRLPVAPSPALPPPPAGTLTPDARLAAAGITVLEYERIHGTGIRFVLRGANAATLGRAEIDVHDGARFDATLSWNGRTMRLARRMEHLADGSTRLTIRLNDSPRPLVEIVVPSGQTPVPPPRLEALPEEDQAVYELWQYVARYFESQTKSP